jgi:hypothetical protein
MSDLDHSKKLKRRHSDAEDMVVPDWVGRMDEPRKRKFQRRAKDSLEAAIEEDNLLKGWCYYRHEKFIELTGWTCCLNGCGEFFISDFAFFDHLRHFHRKEEKELAQFRWLCKEHIIRTENEAKRKKGIHAANKRAWAASLQERKCGWGNTSDVLLPCGGKLCQLFRRIYKRPKSND